MVSHEIEIYRGFHIRMSLKETRTQWVCEVGFAGWDKAQCESVPPEFKECADKSNVGALTFSIAMQNKARALIDDWLALRNERWHLKLPYTE
jgi:hypothetical protein